jgi:ABC-2 type transport system permease protein
MTSLAGTGTLLRLAWRRDRVVLPLGVVGVTAMAVGSAQATLALYPTTTSIGPAVVELLTNPAALALYGPVADDTNPEAFAVFKMTLLGAVFLAILGYALVRRHTRSEEELGRLELLGAGVVGRHAPLAAGVLMGTAAVVASCVLLAAGYAAIGMSVAGAVAAACGWLATGLAFVGITAVAAQVTSTTRGCAGMSMGALGLAYLLRAVADTSASAPRWLSWISPLGWSQQAQAFGANHSWVGLLGVGALAGCLAVAAALLERRDLGGGLLPVRPGAAHATARLGTAFGLTWRLARGGALGWLAGFAVMGGVVGLLAKSAVDMLKDPAIADLLRTLGGGEGLLLDVYVSTELGFAAVVAAAFGVVTVLRARSEETQGHAEVVLATATTRWRWFGSHLAVAALGSAVLLLLVGLVIGAVDAANGGAIGIGPALAGGAARIPAAWVMIGVAALAVGGAPAWAAEVAWAWFALSFALGEFGALLRLPGWLIDLSAFTHSPRVPVEAFQVTPTLLLSALAAALAATALVAFGRRDVSA